MTVSFDLNGSQIMVEAEDVSLLEVLREHLGIRSVKDGCSPQGQCGCCTVLVDGAPRVSCVTPARRVEGRAITTIEGLPDEVREGWGDAFCSTGGSQCGFCTPGIILRLEALRAKGATDERSLGNALAAHLCRCTGWRTIVESHHRMTDAPLGTETPVHLAGPRDLAAAGERATLEGHAPQRVHPTVALGSGGFADDLAPPDALVAVPDGLGGWALAATLADARTKAGKVQGRRTTVEPRPPLAVPEGDWVATLTTSWVEPAYLETDASWCVPGGEPASPLANGGAFGGKAASPLGPVARRLADEHGRPVRVLWSREDAVRFGPKRPPIAAGVRADGTGVIRVARTDGIADVIAAYAPGFVVEEVDVPGPPTSAAVRGAGWVEAAVLLAAARHVGTSPPADPTPVRVVAPNGAVATAIVGPDGGIDVTVDAGDPLDRIVLRSYAIGAAHQALGWVTSEGLAVDDDGEVHDLTIRSFGVLRSSDTPRIDIAVRAGDGAARNGSDAVFAAVAAARWIHEGLPVAWPTGSIGTRR